MLNQLIHTMLPILKKYKITKAGIFGSYSRDQQNQNSDLDVLVELGESISLLDFVRIKFELEDALQKKVDLVEYKSIKSRLKAQILKEEIRIYG